MDMDPQHEAGSRLHQRAPNGHADSEIQRADLPEAEANSRLSTVREMARDFQVSIRALRFYEDRGLLHPRRENTNRRYDARDRLHLKMILKNSSGSRCPRFMTSLRAGERILARRNSRWLCCRSRSRRRSATSNASAAKSMRLSIPCVRRIGGCTTRLPKERGFPSDPAIKVGPEIVGRVFRQGPACSKRIVLTVVRDAVVTAICRRFDNRTFEADPEHGPVL